MGNPPDRSGYTGTSRTCGPVNDVAETMVAAHHKKVDQ